jgi:hypothetical protein
MLVQNLQCALSYGFYLQNRYQFQTINCSLRDAWVLCCICTVVVYELLLYMHCYIGKRIIYCQFTNRNVNSTLG